jgi:rfaE bifunctional protein kinase chain/domain
MAVFTPLPTAADIAQARVMVVGDVMLDRYWYGAVDRISPEAPVPVVRVTREEERSGGAANVAHNVAALGARASLLSVVGADDASHRLEALLSTTGIQTYFARDPELKTTVKLRVIGRQQQLIRLDFENTPRGELLANQTTRLAELAPGCGALLFSDYGKGGLGHVADMIALARSLHIATLVDPKGSDYSSYRGATLITPNRAELQQVIGTWSDEADLHAKAQALRGTLQLDALLLTRSEEGMTLFDSAGALSIAAQAREVFDVTGAGDTVIAAMGTLMAAGLTARQALPWANKAGGIVVGKFGTASVSYQELSV